VADWWRLSAGFTLLRKDFRNKPGSLDFSGFESTGVDPDHWLKLRSQMMLGDNVDLDVNLRAYDATPVGMASGYSGAKAYVELNARLAWRINDDVELSVAGFNLLNERHAEASETRRNEIPRSAHLGVRWAY
jgi:iron complex outermembrane receptor protein